MMMMFHAGAKCIINKRQQRQRLSRLPQDVCLSLAAPPSSCHLPPPCPVGVKSANFTHFHLLQEGEGAEEPGCRRRRSVWQRCVIVCVPVCVQRLLAVFNFIAKENEARTKQEQKKMRGNLGAQMKPKAKDTACHSLCAKLGTLAHPSSQPASQPATPAWQLTSQGFAQSATQATRRLN